MKSDPKALLTDEPEDLKGDVVDERDDDATAESDTDDAEATADADEDLAVQTPANESPSGRRWFRVGFVVLAIALLASAGLTTWLYLHTYRPDRATDAAAEQSVLDAAKEGTVAALSYAPESLDKDLDTAKSHLTGDFLTYYSQFTDQVVRPAVKQKQVSTNAEVVRAAVSEMHPDTATVLLFVNQTTTSADRADPSMAASSVVVTMTKVDGKWLISAFNPV